MYCDGELLEEHRVLGRVSYENRKGIGDFLVHVANEPHLPGTAAHRRASTSSAVVHGVFGEEGSFAHDYRWLILALLPVLLVSAASIVSDLVPVALLGKAARYCRHWVVSVSGTAWPAFVRRLLCE